jgi:hypothetical protein
MIKVKLNFPGWPIERQTPGHHGVWGNCQFLCNQDVEECDFWVVFDVLGKRREKTRCPRDNTIFIACESPSIRTYPKKFLSQFAHVITCQRDIEHQNPVFGQVGFPWHIGRNQRNHVNVDFSKDYDQLSGMTNFSKSKLVSVVTSSKNHSEGQRLRLAFIDTLRRELGDVIDIFGRGVREIEDKWDALADYKYHISLENHCLEDWWTEKISDPILAGCHSLYYGCPNIDDYFHSSSTTKIDISDPDSAVKIIKSCLDSNAYEEGLNNLSRDRERVLNEYNLFPLLTNFINGLVEQYGLNENRVRVALRKERSNSNVINQVIDKISAPFLGRL